MSIEYFYKSESPRLKFLIKIIEFVLFYLRFQPKKFTLVLFWYLFRLFKNNILPPFFDQKYQLFELEVNETWLKCSHKYFYTVNTISSRMFCDLKLLWSGIFCKSCPTVITPGNDPVCRDPPVIIMKIWDLRFAVIAMLYLKSLDSVETSMEVDQDSMPKCYDYSSPKWPDDTPLGFSLKIWKLMLRSLSWSVYSSWSPLIVFRHRLRLITMSNMR